MNDNIHSLAAARAKLQPKSCLTCGHRVGLRAFPRSWWCGVQGLQCWEQRDEELHPQGSCGPLGAWWIERGPSIGDLVARWLMQRIRK